MNLTYFKSFAPLAMAALVGLGSTSCMSDLDVKIDDEQTYTEIDIDQYIAKIYSSTVLTGQKGGSGDPDMSQFDEGNSAFFRRIFEANELCSDEVIWTWQGDDGIPELTNMSWDASHGYTELTYYRLMYNITLCTFYLDSSEAAESDATKEAKRLQNRAEVRFMRAMYYSYFIDLYGRAPFKEHVTDASGQMTTTLPTELSRSDAFDYVVKELKAINGEDKSSKEVLMDNANTKTNYGRACKVAADMLLARMYLNAEVYTGKANWDEAIKYATRVINSGYKLNVTPKGSYTAYQQLFMGDNGENANARQEIIFPICCDGNKTRSYGGSTYCVASTLGSGTPNQSLANSNWTCNRSRQALVDKFVNNGASFEKQDISASQFATMAKDDRAMFFVDANRTYSTEEKTTFTAGFSIMKWDNTHSDGSAVADQTFADTDIPFLRVAEAYLTRAEAQMRKDGTYSQAVLDDINALRERARASKVTSLTFTDLCDEWCREFYMEGRRRSDLIRFGLLTTGSYVWDWKGGSYDGAGVSSIYKLYPIPANETKSNENIHQNTGY